ncbi:MAG TPA: M23 family metallopeptidase [Deltaproteobacteria bacterium]|nr:M23 family metallopeptidase [Deltaproteobacteria bacterium]HOI07888.1 M23 family metallopeptidase [Deltaproteobacteria bacterium]
MVSVLIGTGSYAKEYIRNIKAKETVIRSPEPRVATLSKDVRTSVTAPVLTQTLSQRQDGPITRVYTIEDGDSFYEVLKANGLSAEEALAVINKSKQVFNTSRIKPGNQIQFVYSSEDQTVVGINYEISDLRKLVVKISGDRITARKVEMDREEHFVATTDSLPIPKERLQGDSRQADSGCKPSEAALDEQECFDPGLRQIDFKVKKGHSLFNILAEAGVSRAEIDTFTKSVKGVYNLRSIQPGRTMSVWLTRDRPAHIKRMTYEINDTDYLDVSNVHGAFKARKRELAMDVRLESAQGRISSSLYQSAVSEGVSPEVVMKLADIFAHDVNFFTSIQPGDTYAVLYEKYYVKDRFKGYGRVLAARFVNQGENHTAIYYENKRRGVSGYFDEKGKPMKKLFLKAPLNYRRISSAFSKNRRHPIFGVVRPHLGVDYAAPTGTPVSALGPGKVSFKGWVNGFGNTVRVRHPGGYVTYYGHLSRFAKGISVGKSVDQGDTIAYVGSTGYSTGPHLDFRVSLNGKYINPLKMKNVTGPPLRGKVLADFKHVSTARLAMMENKSRNIAQTAPEAKTGNATKYSPKG